GKTYDYRTEYQRDRDRIIHCKSFRRLSHKTQVFIAPEGDHYRTRLTHTLEVAQIARSVARALRLNEDLTEAIALGHDLGHTPFGHTGEDAVTKCLERLRDGTGAPGAAGLPGAPPRYPTLEVPFRHSRQSLRVVERLEYEGKGLNLTWEVRDGIAHHSGDDEKAATLEGRIVAIADRIAYVNHDIDDALRARVLAEEDLPAGPTGVLGHKHAERITTMIRSLVEHSLNADDIAMEPDVRDAMLELRQYLFDHVYLGGDAKREGPKANALVVALFEHFMAHPEELPDDYRPDLEGTPYVGEVDLPQAVVDYVAGMTDRYAIRTFERLFVPRIWRQV
ncbi:MAG TPA: deoxyguanosinetriphosphate triphosphohydrolase family protein, partial [Coriobacteriia bacterium]